MQPLQIVKPPTKVRATVYLKPTNRERLFKLAKQKGVGAGAIIDKLIEERLK